MRAPLIQMVLPLMLLGVWLVAVGGKPAPKALPRAVVVAPGQPTVEPVPLAKPPAVSYQRDVAPLLAAKCSRCHTANKPDGKLLTTSRAALLRGGVSGPALEPSQPDKSLLVELIHFNEMPPKRGQPRVTADELKLLKAWIAAGALEN